MSSVSEVSTVAPTAADPEPQPAAESNTAPRKRCIREEDEQKAVPQAATEVPSITQSSSTRIVDVHGDLMTSPDALAHCVSACMAMGKGIAVLFKKRFGRIDELKAQKIGVGGVAVLDLNSVPSERRYVYYLVTKPLYHQKPTYGTLEASLRQMFQHMTDHGVASVAIPEIGCGLDLLQWPKVHQLLCRLLEEYPAVHRVTVYHYSR